MSDSINELSKQPKKSNGVAAFALFLCLSLTLAVSYLYYQVVLLKNEFQDKLNHYKVSNNYFQQENDKQNEKIIELQNSVTQFNNQIGSSSEVKQNIVLFQLNQLINAAVQSLIVYHDIKNTIRLLTYAKNTINVNQAVYTELKFAINEDIVKLEQVEENDVISLTAQLEQLNSQINGLQSFTQKVTLTTKNDLQDNQNKWQRFWGDIKNILVNLVSISRVDTNAQIILMPDQEYIVKQNIKLNLLNAKMALTLHDDAVWKYSLTNVINLLNGYFISNSYNVGNKNLISVFEKLSKMNISDSSANIDKTLKALNKLNSYIQ